MSETASMSSEMNPVALSSDSDSVHTRSAEHGQLRNDVVNSISQQSLDSDTNPDEEEEKQRFISQVLDLQNTLDDLSQRVDSVKEENLKLKSENQVLGQYIENLMSASSVFQSTSPKGGKK